MPTFYLIALCGVGLAILAVLFDVVAAVSRKPQWGSAQGRHLVPVVTTERRDQELPFIGAERRQDRISAHAPLSAEDQRSA